MSQVGGAWRHREVKTLRGVQSGNYSHYIKKMYINLETKDMFTLEREKMEDKRNVHVLF